MYQCETLCGGLNITSVIALLFIGNSNSLVVRTDQLVSVMADLSLVLDCDSLLGVSSDHISIQSTGCHYTMVGRKSCNCGSSDKPNISSSASSTSGIKAGTDSAKNAISVGKYWLDYLNTTKAENEEIIAKTRKVLNRLKSETGRAKKLVENVKKCMRENIFSSDTDVSEDEDLKKYTLKDSRANGTRRHQDVEGVVEQDDGSDMDYEMLSDTEIIEEKVEDYIIPTAEHGIEECDIDPSQSFQNNFLACFELKSCNGGGEGLNNVRMWPVAAPMGYKGVRRDEDWACGDGPGPDNAKVGPKEGYYRI